MAAPVKPLTYTPEGAVSISYNDLKQSPLSLGQSIEEAFGSSEKSLGIIIVRDLPQEYKEYRERLLRLSYGFAHLDEANREKYTDPASRYSFGWSHGKEIMNGRPDYLKGSYYANPIVDVPTVSEEEKKEFPEYYGNNIWPSKDEAGVEGFEAAFKDLGRLIVSVGVQLAEACQPFASSHLPDSVTLPQLIADSQTCKARLLYYFPPPVGTKPSEDEPVDSWCGFHKDHSVITGLCSALFLKTPREGGEPTAVASPSPISGLYIRNRGGDLVKVAIPADCLAFQVGESLEVATGNRLRATPHCVRVGFGEDAELISRSTYALFMNANTDQKLSEDITFGQFSKKIFEEHYQS